MMKKSSASSKIKMSTTTTTKTSIKSLDGTRKSRKHTKHLGLQSRQNSQNTSVTQHTDPHLTLPNATDILARKKHEEFHKYLSDAGYFDKLSNVIAKLYQEESIKDTEHDPEFYERNVAAYLKEHLAAELVGLPWEEQLDIAKRRRDSMSKKIEQLENEKTRLNWYKETGTRYLKKAKSVAISLTSKDSKKKFKAKGRLLGMLKVPTKKTKSTASTISSVASRRIRSATDQGFSKSQFGDTTTDDNENEDEENATATDDSTKAKSMFNFGESSKKKKRNKKISTSSRR